MSDDAALALVLGVAIALLTRHVLLKRSNMVGELQGVCVFRQV